MPASHHYSSFKTPQGIMIHVGRTSGLLKSRMKKRNKEIIEMRKNGMTLREISAAIHKKYKDMGISYEQVRIILIKEKRNV